ncbi:ABC transporter substrate-binding protein [Jiangella alkaliphila]|uniref:Multiple sugar transport system substrate-binding protein n=1 Tax=Jiangella alkaliphila TaxID=419479 RepID=A0A1H2GW42_9ACTN|nr:sugar ABC transporter substrate-binding protein [Jiangella alkaliphila]SDU23729.1 multiple sugar transport system substrate-binding protein [Jiangella alkaliphila]
MTTTHRTHRARRLTAPAAALTLLVLAGCGGSSTDDGGSDGGPTGTADDPVEITFWSWLPDIQTTIDLFEETHPEIDVKLENVGVGTDQYTKIQNAVDAGSGGPDVAHMTYDAIPSFALTGALADLAQHGGEDIPDTFLPAVVSLVQQGDAIYGVPQDFGPGVMYYRTDVFDAAGVEVPTTWAEYATAAEAIHAGDPNRYITYLDPGLADAAYMGLWQLDAAPWTLEGESDLTLDLGSEASLRWADYWDGLNHGGLTIESVQGSDEWFRQLGEGQIATWVVGAWGLQALTGVVPQNEGLWRVAPMPVWDDGDTATSQFGGSGTVVLEQSEHKDAATTFALWMNSDPVAVESLKNDQGLLPTTNAAWEDPAFLDEEIAYLGGQQARQVFAESARNSVTTWRWLPFQPYVGSVYKDTVGQAISGKTSLADGFAAWQDRVAEYAQQQGFTVTTD